MDMTLYALLNKKIKGLVSGVRSAVVQGTTIVFTMNDGSTQTMTFPTPADGQDGFSPIVDVRRNDANDGAIISITDKDGLNEFEIKDGKDGLDGFSPTIEENVGNTADDYRLDITDKNGTITTPNLIVKGADGQGVPAGGDTGQILVKKSEADFDTEWQTPQAGTVIVTDATPTQGSQNPVQSGGVFDALELKQDRLTGNDGQFVGFDAQGNPIAVDAPDMGTTVIEISKQDYDLLTDDERKDKVYYIYDDDENQGQTLEYADQRPTTTNAKMGDIVFNSLPEPNGYVGWVYTAFGWLGFGQIEGTQVVGYLLNDNTVFMVNDGNGGGTPFLYRDVI